MSYASYSDLKQRKPFRWWHEAIIDDMLAFPTDGLAERSKRLGYSISYLSIVMNSDMFRAAYTARRRAFSERLDASLQTKTAMAADRAMDIILETLEKKRDTIPFQAVADFADKTLSKLGYGAKPSSPVSVHFDNRQQSVTVSAEELREARGALRAVEAQRALEPPADRPLIERPMENPPAFAERPVIEATVSRGAVEELA